MGLKRRRHSSAFKAKVALDAVKGDKTAAQLASQYEILPTQISNWKKQLLQNVPQLFDSNASKAKGGEDLTGPLYEEIGRLKMELDWLKKKIT